MMRRDNSTPVLEDDLQDESDRMYSETISPNDFGRTTNKQHPQRTPKFRPPHPQMHHQLSSGSMHPQQPPNMNNSTNIRPPLTSGAGGGAGGAQNPQNIRLINNDMTEQFRGRNRSATVAKIRWFENRRPQVLGFCLCMALLGVTLAFYEWRWSGLVCGSSLTIICGTTVVSTYVRRKQWHQHPNPIVFMRSVLGIFLAVCLLFNLVIDYRAHQKADRCRDLSGMTEFFFFTSEAWGLMMACDLFSSLTSPFTNYKRLMRFYHIWVWGLGSVMAGITWFVDDAAGFFRVDGQRIYDSIDDKYLVGFCLAASQQCCANTNKTVCEVNKVPQCSLSVNFLAAQQWPWILVYSFVVFVLIVSVSVLILAWHRLYLRGVPKTYNIRLRVLNYVSFFTGAYVFYWLLLLLLYMSAYFISTKDINVKNLDITKDMSTGTDNRSIAAQVLRQLVLFLIASKGYLDYVIWFAVNSIERRPANGDRSADVDVDLSPQVNTALRSEILYYTTSGIKQSVHEVASGRTPKELFLLSSSGEAPTESSSSKQKREKNSNKIRFWSYCPLTFRCVREFFGINDLDYTKLFGATTKERFSEGRSGAFMFFTSDESLIVKTMSTEECELLRKMAPGYANYLMSNPNSLLTRFYGCHAVSLYGKTYNFVVMGNLFADTEVIHHRYDIKGSWVDRNAALPKPGDKVHCRYCNASYTFGSTKNQECGDGLTFHEPNIVLKDNDLLAKVRIDPVHATNLYDQLCKDSAFLCKQGIMDYSLLMGVQSCEYFVDPGENINLQQMEECTLGGSGLRTKAATSVNGPALYHFGIIDFLQQWTLEKRGERFYKSQILRKDPKGISALAPKPYMARFHRKMAQIFAIDAARAGRSSIGGQNDRMHPGLLDVVDHGDVFLTQRSGTFDHLQTGNSNSNLLQHQRLSFQHHNHMTTPDDVRHV